MSRRKMLPLSFNSIYTIFNLKESFIRSFDEMDEPSLFFVPITRSISTPLKALKCNKHTVCLFK